MSQKKNGKSVANQAVAMMSEFTLSAIPDEELLKLDNHLCFSLYVCSKEIIKKYKPLLEPYGLTYTGYLVLLALWEKDDVNVKELGSRLYLDSGTLTPLLKKLEAAGYISKIRDVKDERNIRILLTEKGKNLKSDAVSIPKDLLTSVGFGNVKTYLLLQTLHQLMDVFTEDSDEEPLKEPETDKAKVKNKK